MNNRYRCKKRFVSLLLTAALALTAYPDFGRADDSSRQVGNKTGYEVDGRTSASVIAAKRSHSVAEQDKFGLGLYSGVFVIGLIIYFAHLLKDRQ